MEQLWRYDKRDMLIEIIECPKPYRKDGSFTAVYRDAIERSLSSGGRVEIKRVDE